MNKFALSILLVNLFVFFAFLNKKNIRPDPEKLQIETPIQKLRMPKPSNVMLPILEYTEIIEQAKKWKIECEDFFDYGFYGETSAKNKILYFKITNKLVKNKKPKVLLTATIHGNEPFSTGCIMAYAGNLLGEYSKDKIVKNILDTREIYVIPVVSPDSYLKNRYVDQVDPNRNFPSPFNNKKSTKTIASLQEFFLKIKPQAVISGHAFGRLLLMPFGDNTKPCPNDDDYKRIIGKMSELSKYKMLRTCFNYGTPIYGTEVDWYYRNNAFSIVMEFGNGQYKPNKEEIRKEYYATWNSILYFIQKAPLVKIKDQKTASYETFMSKM